MRLPLSILALCAAVLAVVLAAAAPPCPAAYTFRDLHPAGNQDSFAVDVQGGQQVGYLNHFDPRAVVWSGTADSAVILHRTVPTLSTSYANAVWGGRQGGRQEFVVEHDGAGSFVDHAILWSGTPASGVDLHPGPAYSNSSIEGMNASRQVGYAYLGFGNEATPHAAVWSGSPGSFVDLHPADFDYSFAAAISDADDQIVGNGSTSRLPGYHPLLWSGGTVTDLRPANFQYVSATGVSDRRQVGTGFGVATGGNDHALLWTGSAESYLDLNPAGALSSGANDISGNRVVGSMTSPGPGATSHAVVWNLGTDPVTGATVVTSMTDLQSTLPAGYTGSAALGVDRNGIIVGEAFHAATGQWHAALWVPEPSSAFCLVAAGAFLTCRRGRHR